MAKASILVIEDDAAIRRALVDALEFSGYAVAEAADGETGLRMAIAGANDLVLLDVVLPGRDGFSLLEELRRGRSRLPVIMLTARGAEEDRVRGLKGGADDYVVKPFAPAELLARVEAVLRRSPERPRRLGRIRFGGRMVDFDDRRVRHADGEETELSQRECELLRFLAGRAGLCTSRDQILAVVWGLDPRGIRTRTVDMHMARLRERLRIEAGEEVFRTVRGEGYVFVAEVEEA
ncbi:MAG: response regulator transcription factor [Planctomycetes bacterium]|nr:response regulator transcription factor [Planctomycetota bacterium]